MSFSEEVKEEILEKVLNKNCCITSRKLGESISLNYANSLSLTTIQNQLNNNCCVSAAIQGLFIEVGYINEPTNSYYAQFLFKQKQNAKFCLYILNLGGILAKISSYKLNDTTLGYKVYLRGAGKLEALLGVLGADMSYLKLANIRAQKSVANDINRTVNCETANITKTVVSAYEQLVAVENIMNNDIEYNKLKFELKEACELRKRFPQASLSQLCSYAKNPVSKSGMYHRLAKIIKLAEGGK